MKDKIFATCINEEDKQKLRDMILQTLYCEMIGVRGELIDLQQKADDNKINEIWEEAVYTHGDLISIQNRIDRLEDKIEHLCSAIDKLTAVMCYGKDER